MQAFGHNMLTAHQVRSCAPVVAAAAVPKLLLLSGVPGIHVMFSAMCSAVLQGGSQQ